MSTITISVPHKLGVETAKKRVNDQLIKLQQEYVAKVGHSEITWVGDVANIKVSALGQNATAEVAVLADAVRIDIHLPMLLSMLGGKVKELVTQRANDTLRIGHG